MTAFQWVLLVEAQGSCSGRELEEVRESCSDRELVRERENCNGRALGVVRERYSDRELGVELGCSCRNGHHSGRFEEHTGCMLAVVLGSGGHIAGLHHMHPQHRTQGLDGSRLVHKDYRVVVQRQRNHRPGTLQDDCCTCPVHLKGIAGLETFLVLEIVLLQ